MQALSDEPRGEALEKKIDEGFAEMRAQIASSERALRGEIGSVRDEIGSVRGEIGSVRDEIAAARSDARADFRTLFTVTLGMWVTTMLCIVGVLLQRQPDRGPGQTTNLPSSCMTMPSTSSLPPRRRSQTRSVWTADSLVPPDSG